MKVVPTPSGDSDAGEFSKLTRYVRVRQVVNDKFIEFDFAIGDPSLYVELVLPKAAAAVDADMEKWRYGDEKSTS